MYTMFYLAIKNKMYRLRGKQMELEIIILRETSQNQKDKH